MKTLYHCISVILSSASICVLLAAAPPGRAQAVPTAFKTSDFSVFGGFEYADPAYGHANNTGEGFGINYTRYLPIHFEPSITVRANLTNGTYVKERSYILGFQGKKTFYTHYHPYVDFLAGRGTIHFNTDAIPGYLGDNSIIYNYGGGVDVDLIHGAQLRVDYQRQLWSLGQETTSFSPGILLIGVHYTIPFRDYKKQVDLNP